ncbi:MAG TPA: universal stress protein [Acidobacteriaceae bacterium]|jgi:nucleotide-binding universal stress UspA family protein|nr:universal stress protein [Acidobacteriaceae bacterium]
MATSIASSNAIDAAAEVKLDRLFVPVDFSALSNRAVDYARRIAARHNAELLLAHCCTPVSPMAVPEAAWYHLEAAQNKELQRLERLGDRLRDEGLNTRTISLNGLLQDEIPCCSQHQCSDLIVLGANINSGVERLLFGCESEVLLRQAGCPVLVIGPQTRPAPDWQWRLEGVVCASDLRPESAAAAAFAWRLAKKYEAGFTLLHVEGRHVKSPEETLARFQQKLAGLLPANAKPAESLHSIPSGSGSCSKAIVSVAKQRHADLIVMGAHATTHAATHFLRGTVAQVIAESLCPVLVRNIPG